MAPYVACTPSQNSFQVIIFPSCLINWNHSRVSPSKWNEASATRSSFGVWCCWKSCSTLHTQLVISSVLLNRGKSSLVSLGIYDCCVLFWQQPMVFSDRLWSGGGALECSPSSRSIMVFSGESFELRFPNNSLIFSKSVVDWSWKNLHLTLTSPPFHPCPCSHTTVVRTVVYFFGTYCEKGWNNRNLLG